MSGEFLAKIFIFLSAACLAVPLASRLKLGSVLGYLAAGLIIGPYGLRFINNPQEIMHFAEFGVVMMLFVIGLELEPEKLWRLRKSIIGFGGLQVVLTSAAFTALGVMWGFDWRIALSVGMALALSSTALVLQMLQERNLMQTSVGESALSVLLFQDIAVIPILIVLPLFSITGGAAATQDDATIWLANVPAPVHVLIVAAAIAAVVMGGRFLSRHLFGFIAKTNLREMFTAVSLALVIGVALLMLMLGVSPALGAFIAGVVLANSEYKHMLETDLEPFKGLLLGLFFISVGMGMNLDLLTSQPLTILGIVAVLVLVKACILASLGRFFGVAGLQNIGLAIALSQGGEFAFVLFQYASGLGIIDSLQAGGLALCVALSMATTPLLIALYARFIVPRFMSAVPQRAYDEIEGNNSVIIAGYGRFGQVVGRFLTGQGVNVTLLEKNADQIDTLRKFGARGFYGDAARLDVLRNAGADHASLLVVAIDDEEAATDIVRLAKAHFPRLKVLSRARNRRHAYDLHKAGVDYYHREMFDSSLMMAEEAMRQLGFNADDMRRRAEQFRAHDVKTLRASFEFFEKEEELISFSRAASGELENILQSDLHNDESETSLKNDAA